MEHTFESAMTRLEEISRTLSENDVSLDESIKLYEEGVKLLKFCNDKLAQANVKLQNIEENI